MKYIDSILELVGNTPLIKLKNYMEQEKVPANIFAKVEFFNPAGSVKDRVAKQMILDGLKTNKINEKTILIEPTSGNTGLGLAAIGAALGLQVILTMPETMSIERRKLAAAYGADVVLSPAKDGMQGAVDLAEKLCKEKDNAIIAGQFTNPSNPRAHYLTTGPEIYDQLDGKVDVFVAGIGTGGTITGIGQYLKEKNPDIKIIGIEPESSPLLTKGIAGAHKLQGIGANFIPEVLDQNIYDEVLTISNEDAYEYTKIVAKSDGLLVGISSGAALYGAKLLASRKEYQGKNIVVLFPDTGERYLSTDLY